jgi:hypothetical protein
LVHLSLPLCFWAEHVPPSSPTLLKKRNSVFASLR